MRKHPLIAGPGLLSVLTHPRCPCPSITKRHLLTWGKSTAASPKVSWVTGLKESSAWSTSKKLGSIFCGGGWYRGILHLKLPRPDLPRRTGKGEGPGTLLPLMSIKVSLKAVLDWNAYLVCRVQGISVSSLYPINNAKITFLVAPPSATLSVLGRTSSRDSNLW